MRARSIALSVLVALLAAGVAFLAPTLYTTLHVGVGYGAKIMCTHVFVLAHPHDALDLELAGIFRAFDFARVADPPSVRVSLFGGLIAQTAVYRDGLGCALTLPNGELEQPEPLPDLTPHGDAQPLDVALDADVQKLLATVMAPDLNESVPLVDRLNTRALVVLHRGRVVGERYAPGFSSETRFVGWSMTKSLTNTLLGVAQRLGKLDKSDKLASPGFGRVPGDPRVNLTIEHALRMSTGLDFDETYHPFVARDPSTMLFASPSAPEFAARKRLVSRPEESPWYYSSGTSNLLTQRLRDACDSHAEYLAFPRRQLFDPLGMHSAVIETDPRGTFVGSSFSAATARDWAKLGQLYLNDGVWGAKRILPEGWVDFTRSVTPGSDGKYGAHFWLAPRFPDFNLPADTFMMSGYEGQFVMIVPSAELVVVRLGCTKPHVPEMNLGEVVNGAIRVLS